ncbi:hypothetical protein HD598_002184 [Neomicrococcus aestuarii]|uniref:M23ase beta-sheet core domain-containing protein n=1 Tax=Neomicrococcus aestuarii TaxID=556325 RepID=A0A7W8TV56_9MICC|nr:M23 family metallopeptidase [Neomicrococcus aestuarii]MBB5513497.1 hypothetical protein [Neomicrococcus aestuarii]
MQYSPPVPSNCRHISGSEFAKISAIRGGIPHAGIDFQPPTAGQLGVPVYAVVAGVVEALFTEIKPGDLSNPLYPRHTGNVVAIRDDLGRVWTYQHGRNFQVKYGQRVESGQHLCDMWKSGNVSGVHLHMGLRVNGEWQDPTPVLKANGVWPIGYKPTVTPTSTTAKDEIDMASLADLRIIVTKAIDTAVSKLATANQVNSVYIRQREYQASTDEQIRQLAEATKTTIDYGKVKEAAKAGASAAIAEGVTIEGTATVELKAAE